MSRTAGTIIVGLLIAGFILVQEALYIVDEKNQAIVTQVGAFLRAEQRPGPYLKIPFYHSVIYFDRRIVVNDTPPAEYLTLDKKRVVVDPITRWRIIDPYTFYITVRDESGARARLDDLVLSAMRDEIAQIDFVHVIDRDREKIEESVTRRVSERAAAFGIQVIDARSKRADLPPEVQASVFARMVAERGQVSKRYRSEGDEESAKIRADADKERTIILARAYEQAQKLRGDGDAAAAGIYAEAFDQDPEFYSFVRSLQAYEHVLGDRSMMVLSTDSDLLRYLRSARPLSSGGGGATP